MKYLLIYGSQTGQSEAIAEQIALESVEQGLEEVELLSGEEVELERLYQQNQVVVFVVSSTGEGDPPEKFEQFWVDMNDRAPSQLNFTLLGLGDTNYTEFGGFPDKLNHYLVKSGAKNFYKYDLADDAVGLELVVEPWIEGLWEPLKQCLANLEQDNQPDSDIAETSLKLDSAVLEKLASLQIIEERPKTKLMFKLEFSNENFNEIFPHGVDKFILPFATGNLEKCSVLNTLCLTEADDKVKETTELELTTSEQYGAGDSFGILSENSDAEVTNLLSLLQLSHSSHTRYNLTPDSTIKARLLPKHVLLNSSPYYALKYTLDLRSLPKKAFLRYLSECCSAQRESDYLYLLSSREGSIELNELIYKNALTVTEILEMVPSCVPSLAGLLQFLPRLTPRYYSVARIAQSSIKFVFNHVTNIRSAVAGLPEIPGVCTTWLRSLKKGDTVYAYKRKNDHFKPPTDKPVLMIGAGTGVSPFLGFLDHIAARSPDLPTTLITGNRYKQLDSVYADHFTEHQTNNVLKSYRTAYSRDPSSTCRYVQDVLRRDAKDIVNLLDEGAAVFVCGDAKGLGAGVYDTFRTMIGQEKGVGKEEAELVLAGMKRSQLYCEDIWS